MELRAGAYVVRAESGASLSLGPVKVGSGVTPEAPVLSLGPRQGVQRQGFGRELDPTAALISGLTC